MYESEMRNRNNVCFVEQILRFEKTGYSFQRSSALFYVWLFQDYVLFDCVCVCGFKLEYLIRKSFLFGYWINSGSVGCFHNFKLSQRVFKSYYSRYYNFVHFYRSILIANGILKIFYSRKVPGFTDKKNKIESFHFVCGNSRKFSSCDLIKTFFLSYFLCNNASYIT